MSAKKGSAKLKPQEQKNISWFKMTVANIFLIMLDCLSLKNLNGLLDLITNNSECFTYEDFMFLIVNRYKPD